MKPRELIPSLLTAALVAGAGAAVAMAGTEGTSGATDNAAEAMFRRLDLNYDNSNCERRQRRQKRKEQPGGQKLLTGTPHRAALIDRRRF